MKEFKTFYVPSNMNIPTAKARSKMGAWMLIRNWCSQNNVDVPTMDKVSQKMK